MKRSATLVVALVTAAGLFGACSGKSSNNSTTTPNPSTANSSPAAAPAATSAADVAYDQALAAAEQKVSTAEEAARAKASPKTPVGQISPLLLAWAAADDSAGNDLDGLTPPAKAAAANG
ncbi:MAG: hypothetical protein QOC87_667, partial [Actinomycetota bacterium]|nr:hypothetical protein [Actinomycetota bacterium]